MKRWNKYLACLLVVVALTIIIGGAFPAGAASDCITVTSAISGAELYSGNDLQEAFDAAERGSIVSIGRTYALTQDVVLRVEIMISGQNYLKFSEYHIQLAGNGAIYVSERFKRSTYIQAVNDYSEVDWIEEGGGFIYYLVATPPSMEGKHPSVAPGGNLLGTYVDKDNAVIYLDAVASGITTEELASAISMTADYAEGVQYEFTGHANGMAANGMVMVAEAINEDYNGHVTKNYDIVLLGDVNGNGVIDAADASLISFHANGSRLLTGAALLAADANRDGQVDEDDAMFLCKKYIRPDKYVTPLR